MGTVGFGVTQEISRRRKGQQLTSDVLSQEIGQITDRSQIINPNDVVNPDNYGLGRRERLRYESDLAQAKLYAEQQEAAYQEWYDSPAQQAARQREAGLNPDLIGVEQSQSADVSQAESSPMSSIPGNEQIALNAVSSLTSLFSSIGSIGSSISQMRLNFASEDLVKKEVDALELENMTNFEKLVKSGLSDALANAISSGGSSFNMDSFFGDSSVLNSILSTSRPSDDPKYTDAFNRIVSNSRELYSSAYETLGKTEEGRKKYLKQLSSNYYDPDDDIMSGQLKILVGAEEELYLNDIELQKEINAVIDRYVNRLDVDKAAEAFNASNDASVAQSFFNSDYFSSLQGEILAKYDVRKRVSDAIIADTQAAVYRWNKFKFNSSQGSKRELAGWQIMAGSHMNYQDFLVASSDRRRAYLFNEILARSANLRATGRASLINANAAATSANAAVTNAAAASQTADANMLNAISNALSTANGIFRTGASLVFPWIK